MVSAELPPDPSEWGISEEEKARRKPLWDIVVTNMIHGPCGTVNPDCQCMENGKCSKKFPKPFKDRTIVDPDTTHPVYQHQAPDRGGVHFIKIAYLLTTVGLSPTMYFLA